MISAACQVTSNANGRAVIPAAVRKALDLRSGDELLMRVEDGELLASTRRQALARARSDDFAGYCKSDEDLTQSLIDDRREQALNVSEIVLDAASALIAVLREEPACRDRGGARRRRGQRGQSVRGAGEAGRARHARRERLDVVGVVAHLDLEVIAFDAAQARCRGDLRPLTERAASRSAHWPRSGIGLLLRRGCPR